MLKELKLTEDHIKLIKCIKFEGFDFGQRFNLSALHELKEELEGNEELLQRYGGGLLRCLENLTLQLGRLSSESERHGWGVDQWNLFGGTYVLEDVARIIGCYDKYVEGSKEDPQGADFSDDLKAYMWDLYKYVWDNMEFILDLVISKSTDGGIRPGVYRMGRDGVWNFSES